MSEEQQDITQQEAIERHVFEAIGEASMCWENTPTGVFDSDRAKRIGDDLIKFIESVAR